MAAALRARKCSLLRKRDLISLAHMWQYASDLWRPRGNRPARQLPVASAPSACAAAAAAMVICPQTVLNAPLRLQAGSCTADGDDTGRSEAQSVARTAVRSGGRGDDGGVTAMQARVVVGRVRCALLAAADKQ